MTRYVIGPDVAVRLAREDAVIRDEHQLVAPALLRSQVLSLIYQAVRRGEMTRKEAERQLEYVRGLRMRLLGDRVLRRATAKWRDVRFIGAPKAVRARAALRAWWRQAAAMLRCPARRCRVMARLPGVRP
jgi:hypothetical protein